MHPNALIPTDQHDQGVNTTYSHQRALQACDNYQHVLPLYRPELVMPVFLITVKYI